MPKFMVYGPKKHHRRSIRAKGYDYARDGAYFVTICAQNRRCLFGNVADDKMKLNEAGVMVDNWWRKLDEKFPEVILDEYAAMPNHFHGIIVIRSVGAIPCNRPVFNGIGDNMKTGQNSNTGENMVSPLRIQNAYDGLGRYISWFKRMAANEYIRNVKSGKFPAFEKSIWQRNYWEHIIRDDDDLDRAREYIINNSLNWELDEFYSIKI